MNRYRSETPAEKVTVITNLMQAFGDVNNGADAISVLTINSTKSQNPKKLDSQQEASC